MDSELSASAAGRPEHVDQSGTTILQLEQVGLGYGGAADVLHNLDLRLAAGSFHFLMGPSGAGKTSLLRLLSLTQPPSRGRFVPVRARGGAARPRAAPSCASASAWCSRTSGCSIT